MEDCSLSTRRLGSILALVWLVAPAVSAEDGDQRTLTLRVVGSQTLGSGSDVIWSSRSVRNSSLLYP